MNVRKIIFTLIITFLGALLVMFLWTSPVFLSLTLVLAGFIKYYLIPIKKEFVWFLISGLLGVTMEGLIMISGAWSYASPHLFNFPVWLFFLWGFAGCLGISMYDGITGKK